MALSDIDKSPLYIDSTNSRVGIGTSSPNEALTIEAPLSGDTGLAINYNGDNKAGITVNPATGQIQVGAHPDLTNANAYYLSFNTASSNTVYERLRIDASGNVGIGTASPTAPLDVKGSGTLGYAASGTDLVAGRRINLWHGNNDHVIGMGTGGMFFTGNTYIKFDYKANTNASNGATRLFLDMAAGNVGIGNDNPQHKFHITHSGTGAIPTDYQMGATSPNDNYQGIHNNNNSATFSGLALETRTSGASRWLIANEWKNTYLGDLVFRNRNGGTTSQESMRIDSSGRITMPTQPSFMAYGGFAYQASTYIWQGFATVDHNIGSHWNNNIGRFTAPIAGKYMIYATVHHSAVSTYHLWAFLKNGSLGGGNWVQSYDASTGSATTSKQQVWNLAAGDYLEVASNSTYANAYLGGYVAVGAYLIG